ncbi:STM4014 family protein [Frigoriglobus tundricola]|uniref:Periplasmic protein n=1 Tax=Frigoriglobus tundricola TaxID=2774151 RepID=A0A6M5YT35_9BACT|nr:STM4014 family protein [Frigoriglobus tundricola]QJW96560.1 Putative periplasmic protein [Frigoriglobus tundricola]
MNPPRYVLIANPGTKRCETYRAELLAYWSGRGAAVDVEVVPWADVAARDGNLDGLPAFDRPAVVRMESPGKDDTATRLLLEAGARDDPDEPPRDWRGLDLPKGLLVRPGLLYRGFRRVLHGLRKSFDARPHLHPTACPLAVAEMFDKTAAAGRIAAASVPVPEMLGTCDAPEALHDAAASRAWPNAYVKLNTGSSATGIVVLHPNHNGRPAFGITTLAEIDGAFYNSRLVRRVTGADLDAAVQFVLNEGAIVQRGIPMAQADGQNFDVRVVTVYGKPAATIFRLSPHPMTNLHLGGRRGDYDRCRAAIPTRDWLDALDHCADAAACFDSAITGVDLLFERGFRRHYVLEVNAFGDFFPGWVDPNGRSIHAREIAATAERLA